MSLTKRASLTSYLQIKQLADYEKEPDAVEATIETVSHETLSELA